MKKLNVIADGAIIAIANAQKYNETLTDQDSWTWKQLHEFILVTNKVNLIAFSTAWDDEWTIEFLINEKSSETYFRKFERSIEVTDGHLYLINWTDLTSSLQFENTTLPDVINADLVIDLDNGFYSVTVKQLFDHQDDSYDAEDRTSYIVEMVSQIQNPDITADAIIWAQDIPNDETIFMNKERDGFDDLLDSMIAGK